jgi:hypothetical protein
VECGLWKVDWGSKIGVFQSAIRNPKSAIDPSMKLTQKDSRNWQTRSLRIMIAGRGFAG